MSYPLRDYQVDAISFLAARDSAGLFLDMGLGKTAISLTALDSARLPCLVVAPKRVAEEVWPAETALWRPDLSIALAAGTRDKRRKALDSGADIVVIGQDNLGDLTAKDARRFKHVIIDELSGFKSRASNRWKAMRAFTKETGVWGLTGTPAPNSLLDLWAQVFLLDRGQALGTGIGRYREAYFSPGRRLKSGIVADWRLRQGMDEAIYSRLENLCLSMGTDGRVELPPVTTNIIPVKLPPKAREAYTRLQEDLITHLEGYDEPITASAAAVLTNKLLQLSAGFLYADDDGGTVPIHSAKLDVVRETVAALNGNPLLVFYWYRAEREALVKAFPKALTTEVPGFQAKWNTGEYPVLLAHPASAGHGLNLQGGGHTIMWTTPTWRAELDMQANKRLARSGQKHPVTINYLVADGTVDVVPIARVGGKIDVQQALLDYLRA